VPGRGLEPPRITPPAPKAGASTISPPRQYSDDAATIILQRDHDFNVPEVGIEPTRLTTIDFKSILATDYSTRAIYEVRRPRAESNRR
jgi:hypothetical protein